MTNEELEEVASAVNIATTYFQEASFRLLKLREEQINISKRMRIDPRPLSETGLGIFRGYLDEVERVCAPYTELPTIDAILEGMRSLYREVEDLTKS